MKIAVVSDTHLPRFGSALPPALEHALRGERVDLILHLGDLTAPWVPQLFEAIAPFDAVAGNNDGEDIVRRFGRRKIVAAAGRRLGMVHGDGRGRTTPQRALAAFAGEGVDAVLFGHSHAPHCERVDGLWLLNPGSPTDRRRQLRYSFGMLEVGAGGILPSLHYYDDRRN